MKTTRLACSGFFLLIMTAVCPAAVTAADDSIEIYRQEVIAAEVAFASLVSEQGIKAGFLAFADDDAVMNRNNKLVRGKQEMAAYFDALEISEIRLQWYPDFVDVAVSGDLAYTYGQFTFSGRDKDGNELSSAGVFHTVWKRNRAGEWRFVWD